MKKEKIRMISILIISIFVIVTGALFGWRAFSTGDITGGVLGLIIALIILVFAFMVYTRGTKDMKNGFPIQDERSRKVMDRASSRAFYVSLYVLLGIGFLSDSIPFRDVSQATSVAVGLMALLFACFWAYYNKNLK